MPLTVRKFDAQVKDPNTGNMIPAGLLSSDALGAIDSAKTDAISAVEGIQATAEAAIDSKGATTLASIPGEYGTLSNAVFTSLVYSKWNPALTKAKYINSNTGKSTPSSGTDSTSIKYARTALWYGFRYRIAVELANADYEYRVMYYNENGSLSGSDTSGYLGALILHPVYSLFQEQLCNLLYLLGVWIRRN